MRNNDISSADYTMAAVRPLTFSLFIAHFIPTAFIPIYSSLLYTPLWNIPKGIMIALPISADVLSTAVFAAICGYMKNKYSLKRLFYVGTIPVIAGYALCAASNNIIMFTIASFITGAGMGFLYVTTSTIVAEQKDEEVVSKGFGDYYASYYSALNVGCVAGGCLAAAYGYKIAFIAASVMALISLVITIFILGKNIDLNYDEVIAENDNSCTLWQFLFDRQVFSWIFTLYIPYIIASYFLYYFFPLYADEHGLSPDMISYVFLLNGLFVVYLGPLSSSLAEKFLGPYGGALAGSILSIAALSLFLFKQDISSAIITIIFLGIADSFAFTMQTTYLNGLHMSNKFGLSKTNGIKNTAENAGYAIAPFVFGSALVLGNFWGIGVITIGLVAGTALFAVLGRKG